MDSVPSAASARQTPWETSFYVFNRGEKTKIRWNSYQAAQEQELFDRDKEAFAVINLR